MKLQLSIFIIIIIGSSLLDSGYIDPKTLLNPSNIEIIPWYLCAQAIKEKITCNWVYEFGTTILSCLDKQTDMQKQITESIKQLQNDEHCTVIINNNNKIIEGHKHVATAIAYGKQIECTTVDGDEKNNLLTDINRIDQKTLDLLALEYTKLNTKCFTCLVWPKGRKHLAHIKKRLSSIGVIAYEKQFKMMNYGPYLLIRQITNKKPNVDGFINTYFRAKLNPVYITLLILETDRTNSEINKLKLRIREEVRYPFCMHIDDNNQQGVITNQMILDYSTNQFLNTIEAIPKATYEPPLAEFYRAIRLIRCNRHDYCILNFDTMLDTQTIEYVTSSKPLNLPNTICKNDIYCKEQRDYYIYHPDGSFYYFYVKCRTQFDANTENEKSTKKSDWSEDKERMLDLITSCASELSIV